MNHSQSLPAIANMYKLVSGIGDNWGLQFYNVQKKYEDPIRMKQQKQYREGKKMMKKQYITKKGHYLDDLAKQNTTPGAGTYPLIKEWAKEKEKQLQRSEKKTYIDQIFAHQKRYKSPGPNAYQVTQSQQHLKNRLMKLKENKITLSPKLTYIDTCQYQSLKSPGPGNYNPHQITKKIQQNHIKPEQMRKMHHEKEKNQKTKLVIAPDMNTYNPYPISYQLFDKRIIYPKKYQTLKSGWGMTSTISDRKKQNQTNKQNKNSMPGPGSYNTIVKWAADKKQQKSLNIFKNISKGINKSIYY